MRKKELFAILIISSALILLTLLTHFYGDVDLTDYMESARYFSGDYVSKIRITHSYFLGLFHFPFVEMFHNYFSFKVSSLIFLFAIVYSVYLISGKNKKAFWLMLLSPIVWYMAPAIHPTQLASLFFLWSFHFLRKYDSSDKVINLLYSGTLMGLAWIFWDGIVHITLLLLISFFYDKKVKHLFYFIIFIFLGFLPKFIFDFYLFRFPFYSLLRYYSGFLTFVLFKGVYNQGTIGHTEIMMWVSLLLFLPFYSYFLFKKGILSKNKKTAIFLILFAFILVLNPQARFTLLAVPLIIVIISPHLTSRQFKLQLLFFIVVTLLVAVPYAVQVKYDTNNRELVSMLSNFGDWNFTPEFKEEALARNLVEISKDYPNQVFLVGNGPNDYRILSLLYFGKDIKELVSIEDYLLDQEGNPPLFEKSFCTNPKVADRRDMCITVSMFKSFKDSTNYSDIKFAISEEDNFNVTGFEQVKKYSLLSVFEKSA